MIAYAIMTLVAFGMIVILSKAGFEADSVRIVMILNGLLVLVLGLVPGILFNTCRGIF